jgi:hypothetical protein
VAKQSDVLSAILARLEQQDAAIAAFAAQRNGFVATAEPSVAPALVPPARAVKATAPATAPAIESVQGTLAYVASSGKGAKLTGDAAKWWNVSKESAALFSGVAVGTAVTLRLNEHGRVVAVHTPSKNGTNQATPQQTARTKARQAAVTPAAPTPPAEMVEADMADRACPFCSIGKHGKPKARTMIQECLTQQYIDQGNSFTAGEAASYLDFARWMAKRPRPVFANTKDGFVMVGGPSDDDPTPPPPSGSKPPVKAPGALSPTKASASKGGARKGAFRPTQEQMTASADATVMTAAAKMVTTEASSRAGRYTALVAAQKKTDPGTLVKLTSPEMPRAKAHGDWMRVHPALHSLVVKANMGDRVSFTLDSNDVIVAFEITGDLTKETGHRPGVQTSGKQQAPDVKPQPTDKKVKAARTSRKQAPTVDATDAVLDAKLAKAGQKTRAKLADAAKRRGAAHSEFCQQCERRLSMGQSAADPTLCAVCLPF